MKDDDELFTDFDEEFEEEKDEESDESSWREKIREDVSRIEGFLQRELENDTATDRNLKSYRRERERRKQRNSDEWMEQLDHVTFGFILIEIILVTYFILALAGIVPMF